MQENVDFKQGLVEKLRKQQDESNDYNDKVKDKMSAIAIEQLAQSLESVKRIGRECLEVEQSEAFREYRQITEQIDKLDIKKVKRTSVIPSSNAIDDPPPAAMQEENKLLKAKLDKLNSDYRHLQVMYQREKAVVNELKQDRTNYSQGRSEMERLFVQCVEEVQKEAAKRRESSQNLSGLSQTKSSKALTTSKPSLGTGLENLARKTPQPRKRDLQPKDKRRVIELLLENDNVLFFLYEKLFP